MFNLLISSLPNSKKYSTDSLQIINIYFYGNEHFDFRCFDKFMACYLRGFGFSFRKNNSNYSNTFSARVGFKLLSAEFVI